LVAKKIKEDCTKDEFVLGELNF